MGGWGVYIYTVFANRKILLAVLAVLLSVLSLRGQVNICYGFEEAAPNSRPAGWEALPNLDYHYVGVSSSPANGGSRSLHNNGTTCYTIMPDEGLNYGADSIWLSFYYYLHNNTDYFDVGYMTDATDSSTFHRLATLHDWSREWHFAAVDLSSVPTGARIAFFGHDIFTADGTFWIDDLHLTSQPCAAWDLRVVENRADSVRLEWQAVGDPTVTIAIYGYSCNPTGTSVTLPRYRDVNYTATLSTTMPATGCMPAQPYSESAKFYAYREGPCLEDYVIYFNTSNATPWYGTPVKPYLHAGTYTTTAPGVSGIFAGTHAFNTNPGPDGGGMMVFPRTIPPGDNATLRLGNRLGDWESASMLYTLDVDTNENDILVMKYTVAMAFGTFQGPEEAHHSDTLHPAWFRIELMDDTMAQVQPTACNFFYINAWDTAGWDEMNNMYKRRNFSGMAFDLSAYHGRRIHLRVTTCDGAVNNRWCYAYYNFECLKRNDVESDCSGNGSVTFTAPWGFRYRWWRDGSSAVLDTAQSITVATDGTLYHCDLIALHNPGCIQTLNRRALPGPMLAVRDTVVQNDLPVTAYGYTFAAATDTTIMLPADDGCDTTLYYSLHVWPNQHIRTQRNICPDDWPLVWEGYTFSQPDSVSFTLTDSHGADSTVTLVAVEAPTYEVRDTVVICPRQPFVYMGVDYGGEVTFDTLLETVYGCDSLVHVSLRERDSSFRLIAYYSIDNQTWSDSIPILGCDNQTLYLRDSTPTATAWQWSFDTLSFAFTSSTSYQPSASGTLMLVVESGGGCLDTLAWPLAVFPAPEASFTWWYNHPIDVEPTVHFINQSTPEESRYEWLVPRDNEGSGHDTLHEGEPVYTWQGELPRGNFDVRLVASLTTVVDTLVHTCTDTATETVEVVTAWLQFPNLVSPNGDGVNDRWEVVNLVELGIYPMNEVWIYDAWGMLVFHARDIDNSDQWWDPNATRSPDGTYYFRFAAEGRNQLLVRRNGVIEVVR